MPDRRPFVYTPLAIAAAEGLALGALSAYGEALPAWRMGAAKLALFGTGLVGELFFPEHMSANVNYTLMATSLFSLAQQLPWALKENDPGTIFANVAGPAAPGQARALAAGCSGCAQKAAQRAPYPAGPQDGTTQRPGPLAYAVGPQGGVTQHPGALAWAAGADWYPALPGPGVSRDLSGGVAGTDAASGSAGRQQRPGSLA